MATAVTAYKQSFGFDAPPATYADFEEVRCDRADRREPLHRPSDPLATGACGTRATRRSSSSIPAPPKPRKPRRSTSRSSRRAISRCLYALAHCILRDGRVDAASLASTEGIEEFAEFLKDYSPAAVAERTGQIGGRHRALARTVSEPGKRVSWWWTMGVNQSHEGVRTAQAIINLCLITGNIGKPGTGPNSITGQCNAMGSRLFSNTTSLVGGHDFAGRRAPRKSRRRSRHPAGEHPVRFTRSPTTRSSTPRSPGKIKALWIVATNPFHSWIDSGRLAALREKLEFLVVQDMYHTTESAQAADLVLPAAGWGEKDGCFINSERRIGTLKAVRKAPGPGAVGFPDLPPDRQRLGLRRTVREMDHPGSRLQAAARSHQGPPCDITGIDGYDMIDQLGGIQWPFPEGMDKIRSVQSPDRAACSRTATTTLPTARRNSCSRRPPTCPSRPDSDYPFLLLTGRGTSSQWHTQTPHRQVRHPAKALSAERLSGNPSRRRPPARSQGRRPGDRPLAARRNAPPPSISPRPSSAARFSCPMHYPEVNHLTHSAFDPHSRQPNYKACAVAIEKA